MDRFLDVPRDGTPTRNAIVDAALALLREGGLPALSVERVAARADVAKGLVLYHYGSRRRLVELCAERLDRERGARLAAAGAGPPSIASVDALWDELVRQQDDGTARAWLSLVAAGAVTAGADEDLVAQARRTLLDGCAAALAAGAERAALREAYEALTLALLNSQAAG
jgi:AcrR family transcriptional regulator